MICLWPPKPRQLPETKVTGDVLLLTPARGEEEQPQQYTVQLEGDLLTLKGKTEGETKFLWREPTEASARGQLSLLGTWSFRHDTGAMGSYTFYPDGRLLFQLPLPGETVYQYSTEGDEIMLRDKTSVQRLKFTVQGEMLTLRSTDGKKEYKYRKAKAIK